MDVSSIGPTISQSDQDPLLMEQESHSNPQHIVDITSNDEGSSPSRSSIDEPTPAVDSHQGEERVSSNGNITHPSPSSPQQRAISSNDGNGRRTSTSTSTSRSPLNSGLWISVELVVTVAQIVAAVVVMVLAKDEHPEAPLFTWIVGYTSGCIATLPILYWRFRTYNRGGSSSQGNHNNPSESTPYTAVSVAHEENGTDLRAAPRNNQVGDSLRTR